MCQQLLVLTRKELHPHRGLAAWLMKESRKFGHRGIVRWLRWGRMEQGSQTLLFGRRPGFGEHLVHSRVSVVEFGNLQKTEVRALQRFRESDLHRISI